MMPLSPNKNKLMSYSITQNQIHQAIEDNNYTEEIAYAVLWHHFAYEAECWLESLDEEDLDEIEDKEEATEDYIRERLEFDVENLWEDEREGRENRFNVGYAAGIILGYVETDSILVTA